MLWKYICFVVSDQRGGCRHSPGAPALIQKRASPKHFFSGQKPFRSQGTPPGSFSASYRLSALALSRVLKKSTKSLVWNQFWYLWLVSKCDGKPWIRCRHAQRLLMWCSEQGCFVEVVVVQWIFILEAPNIYMLHSQLLCVCCVYMRARGVCVSTQGMHMRTHSLTRAHTTHTHTHIARRAHIARNAHVHAQTDRHTSHITQHTQHTRARCVHIQTESDTGIFICIGNDKRINEPIWLFWQT